MHMRLPRDEKQGKQKWTDDKGPPVGRLEFTTVGMVRKVGRKVQSKSVLEAKREWFQEECGSLLQRQVTGQ